MKKVLLLMVAALMVSSVAMADHLGIYTDASGASCDLGAPGFFNGNAVVVHKFSPATTGVRFKIALPVGSSIFAFNTLYNAGGQASTDISVGYGGCLSGSFPVGSLVASLLPGTLQIVAADLQTNIQYTDCSFNELVATGGSAYVGGTGPCNEPTATETSTWGQVKALYR